MIDRVELVARSGAGGDGCLGFRREKYVPRGGPDGGDGGRGGDVSVEAVQGLDTLAHLEGKRRVVAVRGGHGGGGNRAGRDGEDATVPVPPGTVVYRRRGEEWEELADLDEAGVRVLVARGGHGGRGNARFVSPTNQEPLLHEAGEAAEEAVLRLELKLVADVGIVGMPNAGKSSLLARISAARPRVAAYPFTTLEPALGVVTRGDTSFVAAEVPGLLEGAHQGVGLGLRFLRHAERTKLLLHLLDGSAPDPVADYRCVLAELRHHSRELAEKPRLVAVNKVDLPEARALFAEVAGRLRKGGMEVFAVSAVTGEGLDALVGRLLEAVAEARRLGRTTPPGPRTIVPPRPQGPRRQVTRDEGGVLRVVWPGAERLVARASTDDPRVPPQLVRELRRMGMGRALAAAGARPGDQVEVAGWTFAWY